MMQTDESMLFSREKAINCFIMASSYVAARAMFNGTPGAANAISSMGAVLNPAIAIGLYFGSVCNGAYKWNAFETIWIYPVFPFIGAICSVLFYEYVYKKTQEVLDHEGEGDEQETSLYSEKHASFREDQPGNSDDIDA